jgi:hypothetical protein
MRLGRREQPTSPAPLARIDDAVSVVRPQDRRPCAVMQPPANSPMPVCAAATITSRCGVGDKCKPQGQDCLEAGYGRRLPILAGPASPLASRRKRAGRTQPRSRARQSNLLWSSRSSDELAARPPVKAQGDVRSPSLKAQNDDEARPYRQASGASVSRGTAISADACPAAGLKLLRMTLRNEA